LYVWSDLEDQTKFWTDLEDQIGRLSSLEKFMQIRSQTGIWCKNWVSSISQVVNCNCTHQMAHDCRPAATCL